jgi:hypothetical protein
MEDKRKDIFVQIRNLQQCHMLPRRQIENKKSSVDLEIRTLARKRSK